MSALEQIARLAFVCEATKNYGPRALALVIVWTGVCVLVVAEDAKKETTASSPGAIRGLTGKVRDVTVRVPTPMSVQPLSTTERTGDISLQRMAQWAMNYLIRTPRKELNYEPVFGANEMKCPPFSKGHDVVVPCDTDARMNWEWYYMREISGSKAGLDVEAAFHKRILGYVRPDGSVLTHPGCYLSELDPDKKYTEKDYVYHVWGATKILYALAEDFRQTSNAQSKETARTIMLRLKKLAVYPRPDVCYFPGGMGPVKQDGMPLPSGWNRVPAPVVEALLNYYLLCGDREALEFAKAYAEGIMTGAQPDGVKIKADGDLDHGHSHGIMHALWGIAHLGIVSGDSRYTEFAKRSWKFLLDRGTGAGWFPATPDGYPGDETCCVSDMISIASLIARAGDPEYFDYVERYLRNRIVPCQFIMTPTFEAEYQKVNAKCGEEHVRRGLEDVKKLQGGIKAGCGLNDLENSILQQLNNYPYTLIGCCAPEGMRAIYTTWSNVIDRYPESKLGPAGVYVNMSFNRDSKWGRVVSFVPNVGRLTVKAKVADTFFLRPPHWVPRDQVAAFVGSQAAAVQWSGDYVRFTDVKSGDEVTIVYPLLHFVHEAGGIWKKLVPSVNITYEWLGNTVIGVDPPAKKTPIFSPQVRVLPSPPREVME
jgi:hypothetical protein